MSNSSDRREGFVLVAGFGGEVGHFFAFKPGLDVNGAAADFAILDELLPFSPGRFKPHGKLGSTMRTRERVILFDHTIPLKASLHSGPL